MRKTHNALAKDFFHTLNKLKLTTILVTAAILLDVINFLWFGLSDFQPDSTSVVWGVRRRCHV